MSNRYRCDYCGEPLNDEFMYEIKSVFDTIEGFHTTCAAVFEGKRVRYQGHSFYCHLEGCKRFPMPTKWRDEQLEIGSEK